MPVAALIFTLAADAAYIAGRRTLVHFHTGVEAGYKEYTPSPSLIAKPKPSDAIWSRCSGF